MCGPPAPPSRLLNWTTSSVMANAATYLRLQTGERTGLVKLALERCAASDAARKESLNRQQSQELAQTS
jgi:hypothetical protein